MSQELVDEIVEAALAAVDDRRLLETARLLIDTPSPTGSERACAEMLAGRLAAFGVAATVDVFDGSRANVVATVGRDDGGVAALLNGHLDTTGYGEGAELPDNLADVPIVRKPYSRETVARALTALLPKLR